MRQGVEALDLLGSFVRGQPLEGPRRNVLAGGRSAVREAHPLAPQVVVAPEDRNLEHAGALRQNAFHLSGIHVHTTTDDEVPRRPSRYRKPSSRRPRSPTLKASPSHAAAVLASSFQ